MYQGNLVRLREYRKEDIPQALKYFNDAEVKRNTMPGIPYLYTLEDEKKWYEANSASNDTYTFAIERLEDNKYIGGCGVNEIDWKNSKVVVGIAIGDREFWNKGYGSDAMQILIEFIFEQMNINKIKLNVYSFNQRAIRCYEKCGFKREGVLREELYRDGRYYDEIAMGLLKRDWIEGREK